MKIDVSYGRCGILPQKVAGTFYEKRGKIENGVLQLITNTPDQAGNCLFCRRELRTTVTDLPAMDAAVSSGLIQPIIASGMVRVL